MVQFSKSTTEPGQLLQSEWYEGDSSIFVESKNATIEIMEDSTSTSDTN
jgi:hypothetical protein